MGEARVERCVVKWCALRLFSGRRVHCYCSGRTKVSSRKQTVCVLLNVDVGIYASDFTFRQ